MAVFHIFTAPMSSYPKNQLSSYVCGRFNWVVHAYCQMTNHYHFPVETVDGNLSKGINNLSRKVLVCSVRCMMSDTSYCWAMSHSLKNIDGLLSVRNCERFPKHIEGQWPRHYLSFKRNMRIGTRRCRERIPQEPIQWRRLVSTFAYTT
jgi:hypothetical protein